MSRKGAKNRTRGRKLRSTGTKVSARASRARRPSAKLEKQLAARTRELTEVRTHLAQAVERETATSEVLKVISSSPGDLEPVFQALLANAVRICDAKFGTLMLREGDAFRIMAMHGALPPEYVEERRRRPVMPATPGTGLAHLIAAKRPIQIADIRKEPAYYNERTRALIDIAGARTLVTVPMLKEDELVGSISIYRKEVFPFSDKQIELLTNFAAQAVIAIENTRLLNELRRRTNDLSEALEQQTATSEVLGVISSSPGQLEPVFEAMLANATRLCEARFASLNLAEGDQFRRVAVHNAPPALVDHWRRHPTKRPHPGSAFGRAALTREVVQVDDIRTTPAYVERDPIVVAGAELAGYRTIIAVPMLKENALVGVISIYRQEVLPFTDEQIELVKNFAKQAVIAIENTRLLNELRESLQQQTATAEVLGVISSSAGELQPVFDAMLANAVRLCAASFGNLYLRDGEFFCLAAFHNTPPTFVAQRRGRPYRPSPIGPPGRMLRTRSVVHVVDLTADPSYRGHDPGVVAFVELAGTRTVLLVPMLKDGEPIGYLSIYRQEVRPFTDKQIDLVKNFAAQAVVAIENTRLLNELRESLQQQTATADVLKTISRSTFDLQAVLDTLVESAARLCEAENAILFRRQDETYHFAANYAFSQEYAEYMQRQVVSPGRNTLIGRTALEAKTIHIPDVLEDAEYTWAESVRLGGYRTMLGVPLMREGVPVGVFSLTRQQVRLFTEKQIELVTTFADQAVIAIENVRLFDEVQARTEELGESLQQQTATADILTVISNSLDDTQPVFDAIVQSGLQLFADAAISIALPDGDQVKAVAVAEPDTVRAEAWRRRFPFPLTREYMHSVAILDARVVDVPDVQNAPPELAVGARNFLASGYRAVTIMPMLRGEVAIGALSVVRLAPAPLSEKQIDVLRTFANQAVIAIENTRLLNELRESLQQQTATADVLKVISRSTFDLQTVLNTLVESAARLCEANMAQILRPRDEGFYSAASYGHTPEFEARVRGLTFAAGRGSVTGRVLMEGKAVHVHDVLADPEYALGDISKVAGFRTHLGVPLLREGSPIGVILLSRSVVKPFDAKEIELVQTFADQAVIAIENTRLFDEIQDKSRQLAEASQHKSQFLANMSHELRTPLNAILGYAELILDNVYGDTPEKMREVLDRIQRNGKHLLGLINDVLDLSKIEAGQLNLSLADYSLKEVVQSVYSAVEALAKEKHIELKVEVPPHLPAAHGDERKLTQVLLNLVGNAIKFTDAGEVAIKASAANGSFTVAVRDTGPGIAEAEQTKIFEEFQQADSSITKKKGGTGLGLAIAKRIVELHGGRIWVELRPGQGSTFSFTVPTKVEQRARPS